MRIPRFLLALLLVSAVAPMGAPRTPIASVALASDNATRDVDAERASRSTPVELVPEETTTTTSTTTSTVAPKPTTTTVAVRAAAKKADVVKAAAPTPSTGGKQDVVSIARAQVGKPYRSGAVGPNAFDCSGLVIYVYNSVGAGLPRLTSEGFSRYTRVSQSDLQPGDIVYRPGHVGIYVGNGQMVHASTPRGGVKLSPINTAGTPTAFYRIPR